MTAALATRERWAELWSRQATALDGAELYANVAAAYCAPERHYHTLAHVSRCLAHFDAHRELAVHADEVEMALWLHDIVYHSHAVDNEAQSAEWAETMLLRGGAAEAVARRVHALVLATRHSGPALSGDAALTADIDLAILAAEPAELAAYERGVRLEYAWVPDAVFQRERARVLTALAGRPFLYHTAELRKELEERARANTADLVARLSEGRAL